MRKKLIAGNWKMFTDGATAQSLAAAVVAGSQGSKAEIAVCPPFVYLGRVAEALRGSPVALGAQNLYPEKEGAFTGEISPPMLADIGCKYVILGHSERRHKLGETDAFINRKVHAALAAGLHVILCIGETLEERQAAMFEEVFEAQVVRGLAGIGRENVSRVAIAYEPVWAIGTGHNATPEQAQGAHAFIRSNVARRTTPELAAALRVLYGGSVKADNAVSLLSQPDVDGALVGGASLKADQFLGIVRAAP